MNPRPKTSRILVLTQYYRPEPNFITADVAARLAQLSEVIVVTAHPNYPKGRFVAGTRYWRPEKRMEGGVTVWRLPFFPDHSLSPIRRGFSYLSFAVMAALVAPFVAAGARTVWVYHGSFTTGLAALWFKAIYRARIVFTSADLWPESMLATGVAKSGLVMDLMFAYSRAINRAADLIICSTKGIKERYEQDGIPQTKLCYLPVWVDGIREPGRPVEPPHRNLVYAGNLGPAQKLDTLIRAAALLQEEGVCIRVDVYGSGSSERELRELAVAVGATNVVFHGRVSPEAAFRASSSAFAQIVSLQPSPMFRMTIPSKLTFAFAAAAPILYGLEGEAAGLAENSGGALRFDAQDPASLASAVRSLLSMTRERRSEMQCALRRFYEERFAPATLLDRYAELLGPRRQAVGQVPAFAEPTHVDSR